MKTATCCTLKHGLITAVQQKQQKQVDHTQSCYFLLIKKHFLQPDDTTIQTFGCSSNLFACPVATQLQTSSASLPVIPGFGLKHVHQRSISHDLSGLDDWMKGKPVDLGDVMLDMDRHQSHISLCPCSNPKHDLFLNRTT